MEGPLLKICGMRDPANIMAVAALGPDFMGFIFYPGSKRYVGEGFSLDDLAIPDHIKKVGVFVNQEEAHIIGKVQALKLDYVQLHGQETPEFCASLYRQGISVIKAFGIEEGFDFAQLEPYTPYCAYFLFDTATPNHGGSGQPFDWSLLAGYTSTVPAFLSGGIGIQNVGESLELCKQLHLGLDVNSRYETQPGLKDVQSLETLISQVRHL